MVICINPAETGLYYCQSRYYNPRIARWLNADDIEVAREVKGSLHEGNLYVYCFNSPILYIDSDGTWPESWQLDINYYTLVLGAYIPLLRGFGSLATDNKYLDFKTSKGLGKKIIWPKGANGLPPSAISQISNIDVIARVIFAEIVPEIDHIKAAFAVAQVIKNRMVNDKKSAIQVVKSRLQFTPLTDGNVNFGNPAGTSYTNRYALWQTCCNLAYNLVKNNVKTYNKQIGKRRHYYGLMYSIPFYIYDKKTKTYTKCTKENVTKATHYSSNYYSIKDSVVKIGTTVFFTY